MRTLTAAAAVAGLLATNAPSAHAAPLAFDCQFAMVAQQTVTGDDYTFTGFAVGYSLDSPAQIRCYIKVGGDEATSTPIGAGPNVAVTYGQLTFTNFNNILAVEFCAAPAPDPSTHRCRTPSRTEIPTQEMTDLGTQVSEAVVCPVLRLLAGLRIPNVLEIESDGDLVVYLLGGDTIWDCPPYEPPGNGPWDTAFVLI